MSFDAQPNSLFHTSRAQCPDCGASLALLDQAPLVRCNYCGCTAMVERRLRTIEPVISEELITADAPQNSARQIRPSQTIAGVAQDESHCPTCGCELEAAVTQAIRRCPHCGTQSKVEHRLSRSPDCDEALASLETTAPAHELRQFAATEALIVKIETAPDLADRVKAAYELGEFWIHANARAARLLPRVLRVLIHCDLRLENPLAQIVGKLLCNDNKVLANAVLRAAEKFTFDINGSQALLCQLALGTGIGLKLLLDTADYAATQGAIEYACGALWAVNTLFERNYDDRLRLAEIVLYRLVYLRGPVQAWAIELAKGRTGFRFATSTLLQFMDDCYFERPELVPHIRQCFYNGDAKTEAEYVQRLQFMQTLLTWPARAAALEQLFSPPPEASEEVVGQCLQKILPLTSDPNIGRSAIKAIIAHFENDVASRPCVDAFIAAHGETLPEEIRRAYLRKFPDSPLLKPIPARYQNSLPARPSAFDEQLEAWTKLWRTGIRQAVDRIQERQRLAREYLKELQTK